MLGKEFRYSVRPWEGGDKVRKVAMATVFVDIFTLTRYASPEDLIRVIGVKKNGACDSALRKELIGWYAAKCEGRAVCAWHLLHLLTQDCF